MSKIPENLFGPVPLMVALAIIGALALFGVLVMPNANIAGAEGGTTTTAEAPTVASGQRQLTVSLSEPDSPTTPLVGFKVRHYKGSAAPADASDWVVSSKIAIDTDRNATYVISNLDVAEYQVQAAGVAPVNGSDVVGDYVDSSSDAAARTPGASAPTKPTNLAAAITYASPDSGGHLGEVRLTWDAPSDNGGGSAATTYAVTSVKKSDPGTDAGTVSMTSNTDTQANVSLMLEGYVAVFTVTAKVGTDADGDGNNDTSSATLEFTANAVPDGPSGVTVAANEATTDVANDVAISWTAPTYVGGSAITGYTVRVSPSGPAITQPTGTATTATASGLAYGTEYTFTVTARNSLGDSFASDDDTITLSASTPGAPTDVTVAANDATTDVHDDVVISWTAPSRTGSSAITGYTVGVSPSGPTVTQPTGTATTATATGLAYDTPYAFTVTARSASGEGPASGRIAITLSAPTHTETSSESNVGGDNAGSVGGAIGGDNASAALVADKPTITSDSTTGSGSPQFTVTFAPLQKDYAAGSSVVLYLEDDFQAPDSIPASSIFFTAKPNKLQTGSGGRVYATRAASVETDDYIDANKNDIAIRVYIPDMCPNATSSGSLCAGANGPEMGDTLTMVILDSSGIKNPSEAGGNTPAEYAAYAAYAHLLDPAEGLTDAREVRAMSAKFTQLAVKPEVELSSADGVRGDELTVTGSGFNDGTSATVYVLSRQSGQPSCDDVIANGAKMGSAIVGRNDKVDFTFDVTVPTFRTGNVNWICVVDGEGRMADEDVEDFRLDPSISVLPETAKVGDTVTIFARDFAANDTAAAGQPVLLASRQVAATSGTIGSAGAGVTSFVVPAWADGNLSLDAWGQEGKLSVIGSKLILSKSEVRPNEFIIITGKGFGSRSKIDAKDITLAGAPLLVHPDSLTDGKVAVSSGGRFVATVAMWPVNGNGSNPALVAGAQRIEVKDTAGFTGYATVTIPAPSVTVTPTVAGPRDVVTISGANWPVANPSGGNVSAVVVTVADGSRERRYTVHPDGAGRFSLEHRVDSRVAVPSNSRVRAAYGSVVKLAAYKVPEALIAVDPGMGQPGDAVSLSVSRIPAYARVNSVRIGGRDVTPAGNFTAGRNGSVTVDGIIIPGLSPGAHSVVMDVDGIVAIGSLEVLSDDALAAGVPVAEAMAPLGDKFLAAFHFDSVSKSWSFYDSGSEFAGLNTLPNLVSGQAYWVLVSENAEGVSLNNRPRSLTCVSGDCWNLIIW